jgi:protein involved in polysaccharide export with SLBB domain
MYRKIGFSFLPLTGMQGSISRAQSSEDAPPKANISLSLATDAAFGALHECTSPGYAVVVTVVDGAGTVNVPQIIGAISASGAPTREADEAYIRVSIAKSSRDLSNSYADRFGLRAALTCRNRCPAASTMLTMEN